MPEMSCAKRWAELRKGDRDYIDWDVTGLDDNPDFPFTATVELEDSGIWLPLEVLPGLVRGYFAGPNFPAPGAAHVIPVTSHCEIHLVNSLVSLTFDGGFIAIVR